MSGWRERAACRGLPVEWWFGDAGADYARARTICAGCPVTSECLDFITSVPVYGSVYAPDGFGGEWRSHGMWGGTTPRERRAVRRRRAAPRDS